MITRERLISVLSYDENTGEFLWREPGKGRKKDLTTGCACAYGYIKIQIDGKLYAAHRLAWLYIYGEWPSSQIDHINHNRADNRINNLRITNAKGNARNRKKSVLNKSGFTGVFWHQTNNAWAAQIKVNYKMIHLGTFKNKKDAIKARKEAEKKYEFHKNHGKTGEIKL